MAIDEKKLKNILYVMRRVMKHHNIIDNNVNICLREEIEKTFTEEPQPKKPLKLEVGKKYKAISGNVFFIYRKDNEIFSGIDKNFRQATFRENGKYILAFDPGDNSLIEEVE